MLRTLVYKHKYYCCMPSAISSFLRGSKEINFKNNTPTNRRYSSNDSEKMSKGGDNLKSLSEKEWKKRLTDEQYDVCRQKGTEMPFSGTYTFHKEEGIYNCVCCGTALFSSKAKYTSACGWPSFSEAYSEETKSGKKNVEERPDNAHGMKRTEVVCAECNAHLGHVFPDGPPPHGLRYCINSVALKFEKKKME